MTTGRYFNGRGLLMSHDGRVFEVVQIETDEAFVRAKDSSKQSGYCYYWLSKDRLIPLPDEVWVRYMMFGE